MERTFSMNDFFCQHLCMEGLCSLKCFGFEFDYCQGFSTCPLYDSRFCEWPCHNECSNGLNCPHGFDLSPPNYTKYSAF